MPLQKKMPVKPGFPLPSRQIAEQAAPAYMADADFEDMPPPPDNFPADWDNEWQPSFDNAQIAARAEPKVDHRPVSEPSPLEAPLVEETVETSVESIDTEREPLVASREALLLQPVESIPTESVRIPPSLYIPLAKEEKDKEHPPRQITVMLRSTGDKERDKRRIKTMYGTLISFHGRDRFSFQIFENGSGHLIDFPNDTTRVCSEMLERMKKLMGEESWRVEEITFQ